MRALVVVPLLVAGCSGGLSEPNYTPQVRVVSPLVDDRVPFCPALLTELTAASLDGSFAAPPATTTTVLREVADSAGENDNIYSVQGTVDQANPVSPMVSQLMQQSMSFDIGPSGAVYDDLGPQPTQVVPDFRTGQPAIAMTRELVGGGKKSDTSFELVYEYVPSCTTLDLDVEIDADGDGTAEPFVGSCTCAPTTIKWAFGG